MPWRMENDIGGKASDGKSGIGNEADNGKVGKSGRACNGETCVCNTQRSKSSPMHVW
jgi:hypothetical protein